MGPAEAWVRPAFELAFGRAYATVRRFGLSTAEAAEVADEACARALAESMKKDFRGDSRHFDNFLGRRAVDRAIDQCRKRGTTATLDAEVEDPRPRRAEERAEHEEHLERLRACLARLTDGERAIIERKYLHDGGMTSNVALAEAFLEPDGASQDARGLRMRRVVLALCDRLRRCMEGR
jgi:RNA polymerase sigma factor (sigma-70 family)